MAKKQCSFESPEDKPPCARCHKNGMECSGPMSSTARRSIKKDPHSNYRRTLKGIRDKLGSEKFRELIEEICKDDNAGVAQTQATATEDAENWSAGDSDLPSPSQQSMTSFFETQFTTERPEDEMAMTAFPEFDGLSGTESNLYVPVNEFDFGGLYSVDLSDEFGDPFPVVDFSIGSSSFDESDTT